MKRTWFIALVMILVASLAVFAQQPTVGNLSGKVVDNEGKPLPGATITIDGPLGQKALSSDADGKFEYRAIPPGTYRVKVDMEGFVPVLFSKVGVSAGQTTPLSIKMAAGKTEEVTVTSATPLLDVKSVEVNTTFKTDQAINTMPIGRNFVDAVRFAPGVVADAAGRAGTGNFSISGSTGLENSYVIDGVNITSSGYGGVGTYSQVYGSLGTGITSDFLEEVQVKTAGFEAEYGQALGGVVTGVVKSGTNDLKGRVGFYIRPRSMQAYGTDPVLIGGANTFHDEQQLDLGLQAGGPIVKDRIFWFAAFNPVRHEDDLIRAVDSPINSVAEADPTTVTGPLNSYTSVIGIPGAGRPLRGDTQEANNYAVKLNGVLTANHRLEATFFGDPSEGVGGRGGAWSTPVILRDTTAGATGTSFTPAAFGAGGKSDIEWGSDQQSLKYTGFFGGEWFLEGQFSARQNEFKENFPVNEFNYTDQRIRQLTGTGIVPTSGGIGFYAPINDETKDWSLKLTKTFGSHEIKAGGEYWDLDYAEVARYSGPRFTALLPIHPDNGGGDIPVMTSTGANVQVRGGYGVGGCDPTNPIYTANCATNTVYRVTRTRFNDPGSTTAREINFFIQDTWSLSDRWTVKLGVRTQDQKLSGSETFTMPFVRDPDHNGYYLEGTTTFVGQTYKFKRELSPRLGLSFDPAANGKTKIFLNYARYFERIPSDLAVRAFSNEVGLSSYETTDPLLTNRRGAGNIRQQGVEPTRVQAGTRLPYKDEFVLGWQQLLRPDLSLEVRGIYRKQGRVLEDTQNVSVEEIQNTYYGVNSYYGQYYGVTADPFPDAPSGRGFETYVLANPGDNTGAGFGSPKLDYKAMEVNLEKRLADNWTMFANYRFSRLRGNYEGLFRTDNTQSDPNISSLFDFPNSYLMRGQFQPGPLSNDRPHVLHIGGTYFFKNGIEAGGIFNWNSGTPRTPLLAHPNYQNGGELPGRDPIFTYWVPGEGEGEGFWAQERDCSGNPHVTPCFLYDYTAAARGSNGRTPDTSTIDLHLGYRKEFRSMSLKFAVDVVNVFNNQEAIRYREFVESTASVLDPNYLRAQEYQAPRYVRMSVLWDW